MAGGKIAGDQLVDGPKEGGEGFAAACGRSNEDVFAVGDAPPALYLHAGRFGKLL